MIPNVRIKDVFKRCRYEDSNFKGCMRKTRPQKKIYHDHESGHAYAINKIGTNLSSFCIRRNSPQKK